MAPTSLSSTERINSALQDWRTGDHNKALNALLAAARDNIDGAASLLLQFSAQTRCSLTKRKKIAATIQKAPRTSAGQRHLAFMSASGFAGPANAGSAVRQRLSDASDGDLQALVEIGLLMHMSDEQHHGDIILEHAAYRGSGHAIAALLRRSLQAGKISSLARQKADDLARTPHPLARQLVSETAALTVCTPISDYQTCPPLPESLADRLCQPQELVGETLSDSPAIKCWKNAFPEVVCDYLAAGAAPLLKPAEIFDPGLGRTRQDPYRQSLVATLPDGVMDLVLWAIKDRMARLAGASYAQGEPLSMLAYRPGDHYKSHYDYLSDDDGIASDDLAQRGQRIATALIRLNQEFTGGDTVFPRLETRWSGVRGDALTFTNTLPDLRGDPRTLHKGEPVETGMKILVSLWLRERA